MTAPCRAEVSKRHSIGPSTVAVRRSLKCCKPFPLLHNVDAREFEVSIRRMPVRGSCSRSGQPFSGGLRVPAAWRTGEWHWPSTIGAGCTARSSHDAGETRRVVTCGPPRGSGAGRQAESLGHGPLGCGMRCPTAPHRNHLFKLPCAQSTSEALAKRLPFPTRLAAECPPEGMGRMSHSERNCVLPFTHVIPPKRHKPRLAWTRRKDGDEHEKKTNRQTFMREQGILVPCASLTFPCRILHAFWPCLRKTCPTTDLVAQVRAIRASEFKHRTILEELDLGHGGWFGRRSRARHLDFWP